MTKQNLLPFFRWGIHSIYQVYWNNFNQSFRDFISCCIRHCTHQYVFRWELLYNLSTNEFKKNKKLK